MHLIVRILVLLALCYTAESTMCYFCQDTTEESGGNQCQTWYRTMNYYRKQFSKTKKFTTEKYVKNCTEYGGDRQESFCMIASVEVRKSVKSFIRDCSDGRTFFSTDIDQYFEGTILNDNQTSCHYTGQGYLACVTVCNPSVHGDFCNGFVTTSSQTRCLPNVLLLTSLLLVLLLKCSKLL